MLEQDRRQQYFVSGVLLRYIVWFIVTGAVCVLRAQLQNIQDFFAIWLHYTLYVMCPPSCPRGPGRRYPYTSAAELLYLRHMRTCAAGAGGSRTPRSSPSLLVCNSRRQQRFVRWNSFFPVCCISAVIPAGTTRCCNAGDTYFSGHQSCCSLHLCWHTSAGSRCLRKPCPLYCCTLVVLMWKLGNLYWPFLSFPLGYWIFILPPSGIVVSSAL